MRTKEDGAATVLVVAMAAVLMFVTLALAIVSTLVTAQRRAQAAADLVALAAATAEADGCTAAAEIAAANAATLETCAAEDSAASLVAPTYRITVSVPGPEVWWRDVKVTAEARAGPA